MLMSSQVCFHLYILCQVSQYHPDTSFGNDLGGFAGKHVDGRDCPCGFTCMLTHNDIQEDEEPGFFIILDLGIAIGQ